MAVHLLTYSWKLPLLDREPHYTMSIKTRLTRNNINFFSSLGNVHGSAYTDVQLEIAIACLSTRLYNVYEDSGDSE